MSITITEALAEIKTIGKRVAKKKEFISRYIGRQEGIKDPLEKDGGSIEVLKRERQAIDDLMQRMIVLRRGIQRANDETVVTVNGVSRTISEWLTWRRDVLPMQKDFLATLITRMNEIHKQAKVQGNAVVSAVATTADTKPADVVINIDEGALGKEAEELEDTFGQLDGQLSLKNATVFIRED